MGCGFPRARGDVPPCCGGRHSAPWFSPRTRGCSWQAATEGLSSLVFPAHAGMFRFLARWQCGIDGFPRARGDVPPPWRVLADQQRFSPRTRGCSGSIIIRPSLPYVFPAHAGMFLTGYGNEHTMTGFPRARGDVPPVKLAHNDFPIVFPAHAGMFQPGRPAQTSGPSFPRARGDVPLAIGLAKGLVEFSPRTRGCSANSPLAWARR